MKQKESKGHAIRKYELDMSKVQSPIQRYKAASMVSKHSSFRFRDLIQSATHARAEDQMANLRKQASTVIGPMSTKNSVLERLRLSQKIAEARENKRKWFIDGKKDAKPDDGDHGIVQGFVKRKGLQDLTSSLAHIMNDSPSRKSMKARIRESTNDSAMKELFADNARVGAGVYASTAKLGRNGRDRIVASFDFRAGLGLSASRHQDSLRTADVSIDAIDIVNLDHGNQPVTGFKKIELPKLRDRDRKLMQYKISSQNLNVNKSYRRYLN